MRERKRFLLVMPEYSDFPTLFMKNLKKVGFEPFLITDALPKFEYKRSQRVKNFFKKNLLGNKQYKKTLIEKDREEKFLKTAADLPPSFDHILVIRPDLFPVMFIRHLKTKTPQLIAYQWDGIEKFPAVKQYFPLFDSFYSFETLPDNRGMKKITNFYFDLDDAEHASMLVRNTPPVFYFVGLDWAIRREKINRFVNFAVKNNFTLRFYLQEFEKNVMKNSHINYIKDRISFAENLELVKTSDILLDFIDPRHKGLSIRFFEGLRYHKKVITDNPEVQKYDFYHPQNIFILGVDKEADIIHFIESDYYEIDKNIVQRYSFTNWIETITAVNN